MADAGESPAAKRARHEAIGQRALAQCRGYGKLILFGEHFVVYKVPALVGAVAACYVQSQNAQAKRIGGVYSKVNTVEQAEVEMAGSPLGDDDVDDIDDILAEGVSDQ